MRHTDIQVRATPEGKGKEQLMQSRRRWIAIVALGLSIFMITVDTSSVALALPVMGQAFQQPDAAMTAVIVSYTLPLTLLILPAGLVLTRWPALPMFLVGVLGFAATGALGCACAEPGLAHRLPRSPSRSASEAITCRLSPRIMRLVQLASCW
jgi:MFS family permease